MEQTTRPSLLIKIISALAALLLLAGLLVPRAGYAADQYSSIRVLLNISNSATTLSVKVTGSYALKEDSSVTLKSGNTYKVTVSDGKIRLTGTGVDTLLTTATFVRKTTKVSSDHLLTISSTSYLGDICFSAYGGKVRAVNTLDLEHYLYGVVAGEMGNSFSLEALKAQCICARGYAIRKINAASSSSAYDILGYSADQAYKGYSASNTKVINAVDATKGQVMTYNGKIIEAFYSASNGGQTELTGTTWSGGATKDAQYPYLVQKDDPYDLAATSGKSAYEEIIFIPANPDDSSSQKTEKVLADLQGLAYDALKSKYDLSSAEDVVLKSINSIENGKKRWSYAKNSLSYVTAVANITVDLPEDAQETLDVTLTLMRSSGSSYSLSHDYLNSKFRLRYIEKTKNGWNLINRRFGHGVGMSQMGAENMAAKHSKKYTDILSFYYPGTTLKTYSTGGWNGGSTGSDENDSSTSSSVKFEGKFATGISPETDAAALLKSLGSGYTLYNASSKAKTSGTVVTGDLLKDSKGNSYSVVIYGDLNCDGAINLQDLLREQKYLLGINSLSGAALEAADVSGDGSVTIADLLKIQKHLLGINTISQ